MPSRSSIEASCAATSFLFAGVARVIAFVLPLLAACPETAAAQETQRAAPETQPVADGGPALFVRAFRFEGNTVLSDAELSLVVSPYVNREVGGEELEAARLAVTVAYVERGYINSGAVLPDQDPQDGVVLLRIVEGRLTRTRIDGERRIRETVLRRRIEPETPAPLNMLRLRERLELLRLNANIEELTAELAPGEAAGEAVLGVTVREADPRRVALVFDNHRPPSVGAEWLHVVASHQNLTGNLDELAVDYGLVVGGFDDPGFGELDQVSASYTLPLNRHDTTLQVQLVRSDALVLEERFAALDISSEGSSIAATLRHPLRRGRDSEFAMSASVARRRSETFLLGEPFTFSPGAEEGQSDVTVIRLGQEAWTRDDRRAVSLRSTFSFGVDALGSTVHGDLPDSQFVAWLGQAQYTRRIGRSDRTMLVLRATSQLSNDALLSLEQYSLGGANSVRGYRENQFVRDNGIAATAELRYALFERGRRRVVEVIPFVDGGYAWEDGAWSDGEDLTSAGIGVTFSPSSRFTASVFWGYAFERIDNPGHDLQDDGIHFSISYRVF